MKMVPRPSPSPGSPSRRPARPGCTEVAVPLRLSVTRGVLGLELYEPVDIGPLEVQALVLTLPNLKFPLDLTGGVPAFRHRRGNLVRLEVGASLERIARWTEPRARGVLRGPATLRVWALKQGLGVGAAGPAGAVAFELLWAPREGDARFVVANVRSARLAGPALGHVLRLLDTVLGRAAVRRGRVVSFPALPARISRTVLPAIGARAPATAEARCGALQVDGDRIKLTVDAAALPPALSDDACRALDLAELVADADDALASGRPAEARSQYVGVLERAPRHPELTRLVAEIDFAEGGRVEAALGMLVEVMPALLGGAIGAELLAASGDTAGACEAIAETARNEVYGPVAALLLARAAELESRLDDRLRALDQAVARAPALSSVRWARLAARLAARNVDGALGDAQHLEAAATGALARHEVCRRAAQELLRAGYGRAGGRWFERALRYVPDDAEATAGLARALVEAGKIARAFALFERSIELAERVGEPDPGVLVDFARLLANEYRDLPQAIARISRVSSAAPEAPEARALEARWRAAVGDIAGASLAYGRLRDLVALTRPTLPTWSRWLVEAAKFEQQTQLDVVSAERHLAVALQLAPQDSDVQRRYREVAAVLATQLRADREHDEDPIRSPGVLPTDVPSAEAEWDSDADQLMDEAERLGAAVRADPTQLQVVLRLVDVLARLERDEELLALLSARLEEADAVEREQLLPHLREVIGRFVARARTAGRESEAQLYEAMVRRFDPT